MKLLVLASCVILGGGVVQSSAQDLNLTPKSFNYLKKGVNLDYAFGNNYAFLYFGPPAFSAGTMQGIFTDDELEVLANTGFDHVRVPIEPYAMGATSANPEVPTTNNPGVAALIEFIARCRAKNLRVIVDFHPMVRTPLHYTQLRNLNSDTAASAPSTWPGPYKRDYVAADPLNNPSHPLIKFWSTFAQAMTALPADSHRWVAFEIMNEPIYGFKPAEFGYTDPVTAWSDFSSDWRTPAAHSWRSLQIRAIRAAQVYLPNHGFIATSATSLPEAFRGYPYGVVSPTIPFHAYALGEGVGPIPPAEEYDNSIGYAAHIYTPFRFTHPERIDPVPIPPALSYFEPFYFWHRDYQGVINTGEPDIRDLITSDTHYFYKPPLGPRHGLNAQYPDQYRIPPKWSHDEDAIYPSLTSLTNWRAAYGMPMMVITEFGVERRASLDGSVPPWFGGANPEPISTLPGREFVPFRAQWHYDVRKVLELSGMGWTVYTYRGGFGIQNKSIYQSVSTPPGLSGVVSSGPGSYLPHMEQALFGDTRP